MLKVLVIAENRHFVKSICSSFEGYKDISLELVYHSTNAFHTFISTKPDIVIVHSQIMIPVHSLLTEFGQCKWKFQVLVLGTMLEQGLWNYANIRFLDQADIYRLGEIALSYKKNAELAVKEDTEEGIYRREDYIIKPELYYVILCKYVGTETVVNDENISQLKQHIETVGSPEIFTVCGQDFIVVFKKTDIRISNPLMKIHKMVRHCIHLDYASVYAQQIYWNQVNGKCLELLESTKYAYFFNGECCEIESLKKREHISSFEENYKKISELLINTIEGDREKLNHHLKELYLHDIKENFDYAALSSIRKGIQFGESVFSSIVGKKCSEFKIQGVSLEEEYVKASQYLNERSKQISMMQLPGMVVETIVYSLKHYQEELSLEKMAEILSISKMHLSRLFKLQTNMTFLEFLQLLRIFAAKEYLSEDIYRINEISEMTGYTDAHYFAKLFKKHVGYSPKEFRTLYGRSSVDESIS
ncbi:MAG: AraC family transcriptional regulator [Lachnospiraceae bacterium]